MKESNIIDYSLFESEEENVADTLIEKLEELQSSSKSKGRDYLEAVQDCIDIVYLTISGPKPYPYVKRK